MLNLGREGGPDFLSETVTVLYDKEEIFLTLRDVPLFSRLADPTLRGVAQLANEQSLKAGETLFLQGEPGDAFYVIRDGSVKVTAEEENSRFTLAILSRGDYLGEMALLDAFPRSATVRALTDCRLVSISRAPFLAALRHDSGLALALLQSLAHRLRRANRDTAASLHHGLYLRLTRKLLALAAQHGEDIEGGVRVDVPLDIPTLAEMVGADEAGVRRLVELLEFDKVITRNENHFCLFELGPLLDPDFPYRLS